MAMAIFFRWALLLVAAAQPVSGFCESSNIVESLVSPIIDTLLSTYVLPGVNTAFGNLPASVPLAIDIPSLPDYLICVGIKLRGVCVGVHLTVNTDIQLSAITGLNSIQMASLEQTNLTMNVGIVQLINMVPGDVIAEFGIAGATELAKFGAVGGIGVVFSSAKGAPFSLKGNVTASITARVSAAGYGALSKCDSAAGRFASGVSPEFVFSAAVSGVELLTPIITFDTSSITDPALLAAIMPTINLIEAAATVAINAVPDAAIANTIEGITSGLVQSVETLLGNLLPDCVSL